MASTYSTGGLEIITDGEKAGSWGDITSNNLKILERMASVAGAITLSGDTHTLTVSDGSLSDGHYGVLVLGGAPSGNNTITISPSDSMRMFHVLNSSGQSAIFTQGSGGNVTVANGASAVIYCDGAGSGAEVVDLTSTFAPVGTLADISALAVTDGNVIVGDGSNWVAESGATARTSLGAQAQGDVLDDLNTLGANAADGEIAVGTGAGALAWESEATLRTSIGVGTGDSPQFAGIELGHATDTTLTRVSAGLVAIEGDTIASLTATQTMTNKTLTAPAISNPTLTGSVVEDVYDHGTPGATPAIEPANGTIQTMTLSENATPTDSMASGESITLMVADGASAYTVTWTSLVDEWAGGAAPTLPTTGYAVIVLWKVSTTVYASYAGDMSAP